MHVMLTLVSKTSPNNKKLSFLKNKLIFPLSLYCNFIHTKTIATLNLQKPIAL